MALTPFHLALLPLLGVALAAVGTLVGLGGGFVLVPILIILFPDAPAATLSTVSLCVVFLNASSATVGHLRARRIDFRTAALLVAGAAPAAVLGSIAARHASRQQFEVAFGIMLIVGALFILWRASRPAQDIALSHEPNRLIRERRGPLYRFYVNGVLAGIISPAAGFLSSFFGIGGGVIHTPAMMYILKMPLRVASATALFVLVPTSLIGVLTHTLSGEFHGGWLAAGLLGAGALLGGQVGVYLTGRTNQGVILTILAFGLVAVGMRQLYAGLR